MISKSSENFKRWEENVNYWRAKYKYNDGNLSFDPARIVVVRRCVKCNSVRVKMSRHHKGHEYLFSVLMEARYAARYIQFHCDDVVWLCDRCHRRIHVIYAPVVQEVWDYVTAQDYAGKMLEYEVLETFRQRLLKTFNRWVAYKKKRKRKRKTPSAVRRSVKRSKVK